MNENKRPDIKDYHYDLPSEKIAKQPPAHRASSKLLVYQKDQIQHRAFSDIAGILPSDSHLVFNNTKVIPARIRFLKSTGARVEVFLLEPRQPPTVEEALKAKKSCCWKCLTGNSKRWKAGSAEVLQASDFQLQMRRINENTVRFEWDKPVAFSEVVREMGQVPLPPYIDRDPEEEDQERYQTVFSECEGAVAAPTAGLHFTAGIMEELVKRGNTTSFLTLHVSGGSFQPIRDGNVMEHCMPKEEILVDKRTIEKLIDKPNVCVVGTTSLRTLESVYWYGVMLEETPDAEPVIKQMYPYEKKSDISADRALRNVLSMMNKQGIDSICGYTEIFIVPGYKFRIVKRLITNFHMPCSTLILLVAAFIGEKWRDVYQSALRNGYRFLSYGDSSLLERKNNRNL